MPCAYSFKSSYESKKSIISFEGYCTECGNYIKGVHSASSESYDFDVINYDSSTIKHFKRRPLSGAIRKRHQEELVLIKPLKYQRKLAKSHLQFGDVQGPLVYDTPVLRKARQSGIFKLQGVEYGKNVIDQLLKMKINPQWKI